jgi:hypothetical protein
VVLGLDQSLTQASLAVGPVVEKVLQTLMLRLEDIEDQA